MKIKMAFQSIEWWYWVATLVGFISGLLGVHEGFYLAIGISLLQIIHFVIKSGATSFPTQIRYAYFPLTLVGLFDPTLIWYLLMAVSTAMVIFLDRCILARLLIHLPWNRGVELS